MVDLKQNIRDEVAAISPAMLQRGDAELTEKLAGMC
jgi:hypothetical protein